jgi:hypothetical protein
MDYVTKLDEEVSTLKRTVRDFENNATSLSNVFDSVRETSELNKSAVISNNKQTEQCVKDLKSLEKELVSIRDSNDNLQSCVVDLKTRSMRDNLIFSGLPEDRHEDTEQILQSFIQKKYKINYEVCLERVHRMGKWKENSSYPRNIVAKFTYFKDREYIRTHAAKYLHRTNVWVNKQYPLEIKERRNKLYPVLRQARKDRRKVKLVRDVLYIDGEVYTPPTRSAPTSSPRSKMNTPQQTQKQKAPGDYRQALKRQRQGSSD